MPTSVATPSDVTKVQTQVTTLAAKVASLEAATAAALASHAEYLGSHADSLADFILRFEAMEARLAAVESRPIYVPPAPPAPEPEPAPPAPAPEPPPPTVPLTSIATRIMGMCIGNRPSGGRGYTDPAYQAEIARAAVLVLGAYRGMDMHAALTAIKAINPAIRIGNYTCVTESQNDTSTNYSNRDVPLKLTEAGWWLKNAAGQLVQWSTLFSAYDTNPTAWTQPDANGDRYPQWLAKRNASELFRSSLWDFAYSDNCFKVPRSPDADWKQAGVNLQSKTDPEVIAAYRAAQVEYWKALRSATGLSVMVNSDSPLTEPEFAGQAAGAFWEGAINKASTGARESWAGWLPMFKEYTGRIANVSDPRLVGLRASFVAGDRETALYGLCTALLGDGMFCPTDSAKGYGSLPWFADFDIRLGDPAEPTPTAAFAGPVWTRRYQGGRVLVNSHKTDAFSTTLPDFGAVTVPARAGLLLTA
jgi:hypothetical protein